MTAAKAPCMAGIAKHGQSHTVDISDCQEPFKAFIFTTYGVSLVGDLRADGHFHGIAADEDKRGAAPFRYCFHLDDPQNIYFQDLKRGFAGTWFPQAKVPLDPLERERRRRESEARRAERERATAERHAKTAQWARALWRRSVTANLAHPYLVRKGIGVHGLRFLPVWERRVYAEGGSFETVRVPGALLVPMKDGTGAIWNLQAIFPEVCPALGRDKDFLSAGRKRGLFHWLGQRTETVCLAEGYATAASIYEATGYRTFTCFDAGNLPAVAEVVRGLLPDARIVVCADNDLPDKTGRCAGQAKAAEAAGLMGGFVALPPLDGADFNDWAVALKEACRG